MVKHHQWVSEDYGHPRLKGHIAPVTSQHAVQPLEVEKDRRMRSRLIGSNSRGCPQGGRSAVSERKIGAGTGFGVLWHARDREIAA